MTNKDELLNLIGKVAVDAKKAAEKQVISRQMPKNWPVTAQGVTKDKKKRVLVVVQIEDEDD